MYRPEVMKRNLWRGNIGEAYFRLWWDRTVAPRMSGVRLVHMGYNPEDIVVGREKVEMLKQLRESPDFAVFPARPKNIPLLGISINTQKELYTMHSAYSPALCWACARRDQQACFDETIGNLWYNRPNITNDYRLFREGMGKDIVLVTIQATWIQAAFKRVQSERLEGPVIRYLKGGDDGSAEMARALDIIENIPRRRAPTPRRRAIHWIPYSLIADGKVPHAIAGGYANKGRPPEKVCVDARHARDEASLIEHLISLTG